MSDVFPPIDRPDEPDQVQTNWADHATRPQPRSLKITGLETFLVPPRWLFLKIETDAGVSGWGEPIIEGRAETVEAAVMELSDYLVGADPLRIEHHWQVLTKGGFYRGGPILSSAVAGIDQALWDIAGKVFQAPVHALLGGAVRDRVRTYSWVDGSDLAEIAQRAGQRVAEGFDAVKITAAGQGAPVERPSDLRNVVDRVSAVRDVIGSERDLIVDFHGRFPVSTARQLLSELEAMKPMFVEEPVLPEHGSALGALVGCSAVPLATGERYYSRAEFKNVLESGVAVVQPDVSHAGGISEMRRIASMAETWGVQMAPHCPLGPIALAASVQVALSVPNFLIQEQSVGMHYNGQVQFLDYLVDRSPFEIRSGFLDRLEGPGLGIELDEQAIRRAADRGHRWRSPLLFHRDGSFAEW